MKKVRTSKQMSLSRKSNTRSSGGVFSIQKPRNLMINKELMKDKTGGTDLSNYSLDKMKLR